MIFKSDSKVKMQVINISMLASISLVCPFGSSRGLSIARSTVENIIIKRMNGSKNRWNTIFATSYLNLLFGLIK